MASGENPGSGALDRGRQFFESGRTNSVEFRCNQLNQLLNALVEYEERIIAALRDDIGKPAAEAYISEILPVKVEIKLLIKKLGVWSRGRRVSTPWWLWPANCRVVPQPHGVALILSAWNFPIQLSLMPLVGAIAAGNCVVLKPSELAPASAELLKQLLSERMDSGLVSVVCGDGATASALVRQPFDMVFYTGGTAIGRQVAECAGRNLAPCVLELGGKNPCIVERDAPIEITARRLVWGKFLNAGQACVAPDHVLVHESIYQPLLVAIAQTIRTLYGEDPATSADYGRIVNVRHFNRLIAYLEQGKIYTGGRHDVSKRYIEPTVLTEVAADAPVRGDEIFGPILPVEPYESLQKVLADLKTRPAPLTMYLHSKSREVADQVLAETRSGSFCVNDHIVQVTVPGLPFGGSGPSGMGRYHGRTGFDTFSQQRSIMRQRWFFDNPLRYPPGAPKLPFIKRFLG